MSSFKQHVGVITGGNSGIGLASAKRLIDAGARVAIFGRSEDTVARAAECLGDRAIGIQGDVTVRDDLDRLFGQTHDTFGRVDSVFANAGIAEFRSLDEVDPEHVSRVLDTNLRGTILTVQAALPHLNNPASVIVTTSVVNNKGMAGTGVYAASKAGLRVLVRVWAGELAERGIRVNAISPGPIETPIFSRMGMNPEEIEAMSEAMTGSIPLGRFGQPKEIAAAVEFLAGPGSSLMTGSEIVLDGGLGQV